jgi:serine/threonine protein kinase
MNIDNDKYIIKDIKLGSGSYSDVFLGIHRVSLSKVAIKIIKTNNQDFIKTIVHEITIMHDMSHENIVQYYDNFNTDKYWYIVMEFCGCGTLQDVIQYNQIKKDNAKFSREKNTHYYMKQLRESLSYIRTKGYVHRDIKPLNILLTRQSESDLNDINNGDMIFNLGDSYTEEDVDYHYSSNLILKLADFGIAKSYVNNANSSVTATVCGSPLYMAPELLLENKSSVTADLWSYGIILYEMLFGKHPNASDDITELLRKTELNDINYDIRHNYTNECVLLTKRLLTKDTHQRISWLDFFNDDWFDYWNNSDNIISRFSNPFVIKRRGSNLTKMSLKDSNICHRPGSYEEYSNSYPKSPISTSDSDGYPRMNMLYSPPDRYRDLCTDRSSY